MGILNWALCPPSDAYFSWSLLHLHSSLLPPACSHCSKSCSHPDSFPFLTSHDSPVSACRSSAESDNFSCPHLSHPAPNMIISPMNCGSNFLRRLPASTTTSPPVCFQHRSEGDAVKVTVSSCLSSSYSECCGFYLCLPSVLMFCYSPLPILLQPHWSPVLRCFR